MTEHPIRLVVSDDLNRKRLTVLFRWLLAIPHFIWVGLWGIAAFVAVIVSWFATLVAGRSPAPLHNFLASYVKYVTQVYAYAYLAADPYPPFDGRAGYPVDASIEAPQRQDRWTVVFRALLALPAVMFAAALIGSPALGQYRSNSATGTYFVYGAGLVHTAAVLGWWATLVQRRMPSGLRDAVAYGVGYGAQLWGYLFLLTDRYPNSDPAVALGELPSRSDPVRLVIDDDGHRSRLTVFFRLLLAIPHLIWLGLWGILALLAAVANWLVTLVAGHSPATLHRFLSAFLRYQAHVYAFLYLIANPFPGFAGGVGSYPIEAMIEEPRSQNRWKVAFRLLLAIPALFLGGAYGSLMLTAAVLGWFAALVTGRMPSGLRRAAGQALRYTTQLGAYLFMLTDAYPYGGPCVNAPSAPDPQTSPLLPAFG